MTPAIECIDISHSYHGKPALREVSWQSQPGRICGLLGRNGAGKTTTINILNSFLTPSRGQCRLLGEDAQRISPSTKARIGYLIEGHVQYDFFDTCEIERFYAAFYPKWDASIYYHLLSKLDIRPRQKISTMSCGQRSQVALGLILAQQPDLIILDDFSMGLDPGYRRLFVEVLREFAADGHRSILLTSHIIQDLESLVDDVIIYQQGKVLLDISFESLTQSYRKYSFRTTAEIAEAFDETSLVRIERGRNRSAVYGFVDGEEAAAVLAAHGIETEDLREEPLGLEDMFIALTGKY